MLKVIRATVNEPIKPGKHRATNETDALLNELRAMCAIEHVRNAIHSENDMVALNSENIEKFFSFS